MIPDSPSNPLSRSDWLVAIPMILLGVTHKEIGGMLYDDEEFISLLDGKSRRGISGPKFPSLSPSDISGLKLYSVSRIPPFTGSMLVFTKERTVVFFSELGPIR